MDSRQPSQRYLVLSLDALGDLTLRQPLLSGLLDSGAAVCVVTRSHCAELVPFIDQRLTHIETVLNPYRPSSIDTLVVELKNLLAAIQEWGPTTIICPLFNRTFVDEWLLRSLPGIKRFGFFPGSNPKSELEIHFPALAQDLPLQQGEIFTDCVSVEKDLHECDKFQQLFNEIVGSSNRLPNPVLNLLPSIDRNSSILLDSMGLEAGQYAIVSSAASSSTPLKAITDDQTIALIKRLYHKHGLKSILIGTSPEQTDLDRVADIVNETGVISTVWIGQPGSLSKLLSLISTAKLYVGCDTGPMHFAAALGIPVLAIFGGGHFPRFLPRARHAQVLTQYLPCFGCDWSCLFEHSLCIEMVDTNAIEDALDLLLTNSYGNVVDQGSASVADPANFLQQLALPALRKFGQVQAMKEHLVVQLQESEADRAARLEQIMTLTGMLKESEADRVARGEQIETLTGMLRESESGRVARGEQIETLTGMLRESESDRVARGEQIETLVADLRALFARPGFRWLIRFSRWPEVKKLAERIGAHDE